MAGHPKATGVHLKDRRKDSNGDRGLRKVNIREGTARLRQGSFHSSNNSINSMAEGLLRNRVQDTSQASRHKEMQVEMQTP
jgi:hypothetical protein